MHHMSVTPGTCYRWFCSVWSSLHECEKRKPDKTLERKGNNLTINPIQLHILGWFFCSILSENKHFSICSSPIKHTDWLWGQRQSKPRAVCYRRNATVGSKYAYHEQERIHIHTKKCNSKPSSHTNCLQDKNPAKQVIGTYLFCIGNHGINHCE